MLKIFIQSLKIVSIGVLAGVAVLAAVRYFDHEQDRARAEARSGQPVVITIKKTDDTAKVAQRLSNADLINSEAYFKIVVKLVNRDIKPATYTLKRGMSTRTIVDLITTEKSKAKTDSKELTLTVIEGWRTEQIAEELDKVGYAPGGQAFLDAARSFKSDKYDFLADRADKTSLEGYLFPDTYTITSTEPPGDVIDTMLGNFDQKFAPELRDRAKAMNLSVDQVLIFASLVEREAGNNRERPVIADVYLSRWQQGINLDADPAVRYAVGKRDGDWWTGLTVNDLETLDSPFNLYKTSELPPTPICNPGLNSILGVLEPTNTGYLYFTALADSSGHLFAFDNVGQDQNNSFVKGEVDAPAACADPWADGCPLSGTGDGGATTDPASGDQPAADQAPADGAAPADAPVDTTGQEVPIEQTGG